MKTHYLTTALLLSISPLAAQTAAPTQAAVPATNVQPAPAELPLEAYTQPMEKLFDIVGKINTALSQVKDQESADEAGEIIYALAPAMADATGSFSKLPAPSTATQAEFDKWFAAHEQTLQQLVLLTSDLERATPPFYGSQALIQGVTVIGMILCGQQPE